MKIAVVDDYQNAFRSLACAQRLQAHEVVVFTTTERDPHRFAARLAGCQVLVLTQQRSALPRSTIELLPPSIRLIANTGRNLTHIDLDACKERGIVVVAGGGGRSQAPAELTWALILASLRNITREANALLQGEWQTTVGTGLSGKTLGIFGLGKIGSLVARVGSAFGMQVICCGRDATARAAAAAGYVVVDKGDLFARADVLSLHLALTNETRGIVTARDLDEMKPSALLVNTSRADLIEPDALVAALRRGRPGFAAVDVYEDEPISAQHPLLQQPNALCTPHLGYVERDTYEAYFDAVIDRILDVAPTRS